MGVGFEVWALILNGCEDSRLRAHGLHLRFGQMDVSFLVVLTVIFNYI